MILRPRDSKGRWTRDAAAPIPQNTEKPKARTPKRPAKVEDLAQAHAVAAVQALVAVMQDDSASPTARISAAAALLQWGFGKAGGKAGSAEDPGGRKARQLVRLSWGEPVPGAGPHTVD